MFLYNLNSGKRCHKYLFYQSFYQNFVEYECQYQDLNAKT